MLKIEFTMLIVEFSNRIGNILWQYAFALSLNDNPLVYDLNRTENSKNKLYSLLTKGASFISVAPKQALVITDQNVLDFSNSELSEISKNNDVFLAGYFQSLKLINSDYIYHLFRNKLLLDDFHPLQASCSIHVRRGDFVKLQNKHPVIGKSFYNRAIEMVYYDSIKLIVFSDDIKWCKSNFHNKSLKFAKSDVYGDFVKMACCSDHIIGNSTFGWWAAFLAGNPKRRIFLPSIFLDKDYEIYPVKDLCRKEMILVHYRRSTLKRIFFKVRFKLEVFFG